MTRSNGVHRLFVVVLAFIMVLQLWNVPAAHANENKASQVYYVSVDGNDLTGNGSVENPWKTVQKAASIMVPGDVCIIREGVYRETVVPSGSGTAEAPITFRSYPGENATISGADVLAYWTEDSVTSGVYKTPMDWTLESANQVFINGVMADEARWPNNAGTIIEPTFAVMDNGSNTTITDGNIPKDVDWTGAKVWFAGGAAWVGQDSTVTQFDAAAGKITFQSVRAPHTNYDARFGTNYYLFGIKAALDSENEWWYDSVNQELFVQPPAGSASMQGIQVEAKRRFYGFDLSGTSYIQLEGINLFASSIKTDDATSYVTIDGMKASYISHNTRNPQGYADENYDGITLRGENIELRNSELSFSSGGLLSLKGKYHTIVNNYIHDGNYLGSWSGLISASGKEHYIGYNTLARSGRDVMRLDQLNHLIVEHNDFSYGGLVTNDSGLLYTNGDDAMASEIRYNTFHDMYTHLGMGIYTDNQSTNFLIHHNVIWNVPYSDPIRLNSPSNFNLVFNNTAGPNTQGLRTWAIVFKGDMFGDRVFNNIFTGGEIDFGESVGYALGNNIVAGLDPQFVDPANHDFRLQATSPAIDVGRVIPSITDGFQGQAPDVGAFEYGEALFKTGHDFDNPPTVESMEYRPSPYVNLVRNSGFETGDLQEWQITSGNVRPVYSPGAAWSSELASMRTQSGGVQLKGSGSEVVQTITGLLPNTRYTYSLWTKTSSPAAIAFFGIRDYGGGAITYQVYGEAWGQHMFDFTTGSSNTSATVFLAQSGVGGSGNERVELDTQTIPTTASAWLEYDVTDFIEAEVGNDQLASLNMKGTTSRTTLAVRRSGDRQPKLIVTVEGSSVPIEINAIQGAGVRTRPGTQDADTTYANPSSFNAANWNATFQEEIYLQFPLETLAGLNIVDAKLRMYASGAAAAGAKSTVYGLADDQWSELTITWNNKPQDVEHVVYYDDIGVILPLDHSSSGDVLRDLILLSQHLYGKAASEGEFSVEVLADFQASIEEARLVSSDATSTDAELAEAYESLQFKKESLEVRSELFGLIQQAEQGLEQSVEGVLPGQYPARARTQLQQDIALAQLVFADASQARAQLIAAKDALSMALELYNSRVLTTDIPLLPKTDVGQLMQNPVGWSDAYGTSEDGWNVFSKDFTKYTNAKFGSTVFVWNLKYNFLNIPSEWPGVVIRSQSANKPLNQETTYLVVFKTNVWELQKWVDGKQTMFETFPNTQFNGAESPVYVGAINVEGGVRILCYVNGVSVFDVIDRKDPIADDGYFGFVSSGQSGDIQARPLNQPETALLGESDVVVGEDFALNISVFGMSESVFGGEYSIQFDPERFEYLGTFVAPEAAAAPIGHTAEVLDGELDIHWENSQGMLLPSGDAVLQLAFRAKEAGDNTPFLLKEAIYQSASEQEIRAIPFSKRVNAYAAAPPPEEEM